VSGLSGAKVEIIGLGASGVAAARLALNKEGDVYVSDLRTEPAIAARGADLRAEGARVELGRHDVDRMARADLVVVSPGIPPHAPVLTELRDRGTRWISEPEFAVRFFSGSLIAVTGTNGKTTTTLLVGHLLEAAGIRAAVGGNVGGGLAPAASELALLPVSPEWYVLEMSSFQLADVDTFRPDIGVITNLSPDHLDRYESLEAYYADKARLLDQAGPDSKWVLPCGDAQVADLVGDAAGHRFYFGGEELTDTHAYASEGRLMLRLAGSDEALIEAADLPMLGTHNLKNALAASLTAALAGASVAALTSGLGSARSLPHRLEPVAEQNGVLWVNDSKATNVAAARSALLSLDRPIVLLVGGKDKGEDFTGLVPEGADMRAVIAYGAAGPRIASEVEGCDFVEGDLREVLDAARGAAQSGDVILLSPACSSFDMFESYEDRGRRFSEFAREDV